uniref:Probable RNA polymerase II nuclear localization protein SLC7A6OS n=1 Tax=Culicoides sonorensis TaxID=179676 RepID=A0A336KAA7_CULSO
MSAVIRIKRHIDDEPLSAFLLNCKKRKTTETNGEEAAGGSKENDFELGSSTQILKFAGTLSKADDLSDHILKISKDEAKEIISKSSRNPKITEKKRNEIKTQSQNNRFKIVNCTRKLDGINESKSESLTILDVEKTDTLDTNLKTSEKKTILDDEDKFVFDVYVPENHYRNNESTSSDNLMNFDDIRLVNLNLEDLFYMMILTFTVVEYVEDYFSAYRDTEDRDYDIESEDSNDENYWRNDYPDEDENCEDDNSSVGESDMRRALDDFDIDGERELSSDEEVYDDIGRGHEGFIYSIDSEAIGFEDDLDYCDVNRYGEAYARYRRRVLKNSDNNYLPKNYLRGDEESDNASDYSD